MAQRISKTTGEHHRPNRALKQVRTAAGLSQSAFAHLLGVSTPYIQAVELGQRVANAGFAEQVRNHTGAWARCILEGWAEAVDVEGRPYTKQTYSRMLSSQPDKPASDEQWQRLAGPVVKIVRGAASVGKTSLAMSIVRDKLREASEHILLLEGVNEALLLQHDVAGQLTLGDLRKHPALAAKIGLRDDPTLGDDHVLVLRHGSTLPSPVDDLLKQLEPHPQPSHTGRNATMHKGHDQMGVRRNKRATPSRS